MNVHLFKKNKNKMSRSVNHFFKKSQAVKQPHFIYDTKKCRFAF